MRERAWPFIWRICVGEEKTIMPGSVVGEWVGHAEGVIGPLACLSDCFTPILMMEMAIETCKC